MPLKINNLKKSLIYSKENFSNDSKIINYNSRNNSNINNANKTNTYSISDYFLNKQIPPFQVKNESNSNYSNLSKESIINLNSNSNKCGCKDKENNMDSNYKRISDKNIKNNEEEAKCLILVLQGGGDKAAYQAGAIKALAENLPKNERKWDVITGISSGSVNAAVLSVFEKGDEIEAADYLLKKWKESKRTNGIYKGWFFGPMHGYFFKSGFYDTSPMKEFLKKIFDGNYTQIKRKLVIGATDIRNGTYIRFDEKYLSKSREIFFETIMASAAYPVIFPNIKMNDKIFMDGGVKALVDIPAGINKCLDMGFTHNQIYLDVILSNSINISIYDKEKYSPIQILSRVLELHNHEKTFRDIQDAIVFYENINWRYLIKPNKLLPWNDNPYDFSLKEIDEMINNGIENGKEVVNKDEGFYFKEFLNSNILEKKDFFHSKNSSFYSLRRIK